jgi:hypothetical protein
VWVALHGGVIVLKLLVFIGGFVWVFVRALHVSFEPPAGIEIKERDAPELFAMLHGVRRAIRAPRLHRVLLDDQANASIAQIPRARVSSVRGTTSCSASPTSPP